MRPPTNRASYPASSSAPSRSSAAKRSCQGLDTSIVAALAATRGGYDSPSRWSWGTTPPDFAYATERWRRGSARSTSCSGARWTICGRRSGFRAGARDVRRHVPAQRLGRARRAARDVAPGCAPASVGDAADGFLRRLLVHVQPPGPEEIARTVQLSASSMHRQRTAARAERRDRRPEPVFASGGGRARAFAPGGGAGARARRRAARQGAASEGVRLAPRRSSCLPAQGSHRDRLPVRLALRGHARRRSCLTSRRKRRAGFLLLDGVRVPATRRGWPTTGCTGRCSAADSRPDLAQRRRAPTATRGGRRGRTAGCGRTRFSLGRTRPRSPRSRRSFWID